MFLNLISQHNKMIMELHEMVIQSANRAQHTLIAGTTNSASSMYFFNIECYDWIVSAKWSPKVFVYKYTVSCPLNFAFNMRVLHFTIL
jgi:hypothetical protein